MMCVLPNNSVMLFYCISVQVMIIWKLINLVPACFKISSIVHLGNVQVLHKVNYLAIYKGMYHVFKLTEGSTRRLYMPNTYAYTYLSHIKQMFSNVLWCD